jgi:O-antigen ligase
MLLTISAGELFSATSKKIVGWTTFVMATLAGVGFIFHSELNENQYLGFYIDQISSILDFSDNQSNIERKLQFDALFDGIKQSPIYGQGAGAAASYIRSESQPWAYELSYIALAFQYGIVGLFVYAAGPIFLIFSLAKYTRIHGRNTFEFSLLAGFISFLIANGTNPYLAKFDYMWVIFIPVATYHAMRRTAYQNTKAKI